MKFKYPGTLKSKSLFILHPTLKGTLDSVENFGKLGKHTLIK
jgi:hypothetical protein